MSIWTLTNQKIKQIIPSLDLHVRPFITTQMLKPYNLKYDKINRIIIH